MKARYTSVWVSLALLPATVGRLPEAKAQGTITFDAHPNWSGTYYLESGMAFSLVVPQGSSYDQMAIVPPGFANVPQDSTPLMGWFRQFNQYNYVSLSLTNGSAFGLASAQLADPNSPSSSPVSISFIGHLLGGSMVTNTFTTPGIGATTFATYAFNLDFASELTTVDILAPRWAMDNLVFTVPEPTSLTLAVMGGIALLTSRRGMHAKPRENHSPQAAGLERVAPLY